MHCLSKLFQVLTKFIWKTFPKHFFLRRSAEGAISSYFSERSVLNLLSAKIRQKKCLMLLKILSTIDKVYKQDFPKVAVLKHTHSLLSQNRSSRPEVFCKKGVLRNFAKFTGKHLCQSLFFNKIASTKV